MREFSPRLPGLQRPTTTRRAPRYITTMPPLPIMGPTGLDLRGPATVTDGSLPPQAFAISLDEEMVAEMIKAVKAGSELQLELGSCPVSIGARVPSAQSLPFVSGPRIQSQISRRRREGEWAGYEARVWHALRLVARESRCECAGCTLRVCHLRATSARTSKALFNGHSVRQTRPVSHWRSLRWFGPGQPVQIAALCFAEPRNR